MSNFKTSIIKTLRPYHSYLKKVTPNVQKIILNLTIEYLQTGKLNKSIDGEIEKTDSQDYFLEVLSAYYLIFTHFTRIQPGIVKSPEVIEILKESKLNENCHDDFLKYLLGNRDLLPLIPNRQTFSKVTWRINISPASTELKQATILIRIEMRNGKIKTLVLPIVTFHLLRHRVATVFREMQMLEHRSLMKKN